ncbi:hypothetical protein OQI_20410 [Streptomyces pharetrae CZA14]|uniref:Uncharacterized protein n=1 Tax=Streptomyces pharetrae CZA14 TaxID=1144883 RepID=A0ABX3YFY8_9ACTN|nr:hypothetical protein OQI_20410 [Streptomyces pharetrae CZA14]
MSEHPTDPQTEDTMIAGLLREREGLRQRGMDERVAQVDEQLRLRGYTPQRDGEQGVQGTPGQRVVEPTPDQKQADEKTSLTAGAAGQQTTEPTPEQQEAEQRSAAPKARQRPGKSTA